MAKLASAEVTKNTETDPKISVTTEQSNGKIGNGACLVSIVKSIIEMSVKVCE